MVMQVLQWTSTPGVRVEKKLNYKGHVLFLKIGFARVLDQLMLLRVELLSILFCIKDLKEKIASLAALVVSLAFPELHLPACLYNKYSLSIPLGRRLSIH